MAETPARRVALMSIRPRYAHAILEGRKTVEFRKRPLAADVTHVVIYSTVPDRAVIGYFAVRAQKTCTPADLREEFHDEGVIDEGGFFAYYAGRDHATGIQVGDVTRLRAPLSLTDVLGVARPPQSFRYLSEADFAKVAAAVA